MTFTIKATPKTKCENCSYSTRYRGEAGPMISLCHKGDTLNQRRVPDVVAECSSFDYKYDSEWDFKDRAWILEQKGTHVIGFRPPKKAQDD